MKNKTLKNTIIATIITNIIIFTIGIISVKKITDSGTLFLIISSLVATYIVVGAIIVKYYIENDQKNKIEAYIIDYVVENKEHYPVVKYFDKNNVQHIGRETGLLVNGEISHASIEMMYGKKYLKKQLPIKIKVEYKEDNPDEFLIYW